MKLSLIKQHKLKHLNSMGYDEIKELKDTFNQYSYEDKEKIADFIVDNYVKVLDEKKLYKSMKNGDTKVRKIDIGYLGCAVSALSVIGLYSTFYMFNNGMIEQTTATSGIVVGLFLISLSSFSVLTAECVCGGHLYINSDASLNRKKEKLNAKIDKINELLPLSEQMVNTKYEKIEMCK